MADQIIVMDGGRVAESGDHRALIEHGSIYAELFALQAAGYRVSVGDSLPALMITAGRQPTGAGPSSSRWPQRCPVPRSSRHQTGRRGEPESRYCQPRVGLICLASGIPPAARGAAAWPGLSSATATMSHRSGPDRNDVTSWRLHPEPGAKQ